MTYRLAGTTGQKIPLQQDNNQGKDVESGL
jgi:hypothetical protein